MDNQCSIETVNFPVILFSWFVISVGGGICYAAIGPGMIAIFVMPLWGLCGLIYSTLWEAFGRKWSVLYSGPVIALEMLLAVVLAFGDSSLDLDKAASSFALFLLPSYFGFWLVKVLHGPHSYTS